MKHHLRELIHLRSIGRAALLIASLTSFLSCSLSDLAPDEAFFVETNGAVLPVYIMRNKESDVFVIYNHGGMGTAYYRTYFDSYQQLRESYNIAFFTHRGVEASQGNPSLDSFNWDQFIYDLHLIVRTIDTKYHPKSIFLIGYSWSGYLVKRYLSDPALERRITGYIDLCGMSHDMEKQYGLVGTKVQTVTDDPELLAWIAKHPEANFDNYEELVGYADELTPDFIWDDWDAQMKETALHYGATSPVNIMAWLINSSQKMIHSEKWMPMNNAMFSEKVDIADITIPTLVISGAYDYDCNDLVGADFFNGIGTEASRKEHQVFPMSGHFPDLNEPDRFVSVVSRFIDKYR